MKKTTVYRRPMDENLFEEELTIEALSAMGNPLEQLSALVDNDFCLVYGPIIRFEENKHYNNISSSNTPRRTRGASGRNSSILRTLTRPTTRLWLPRGDVS